jgi:hypothetical protein
MMLLALALGAADFNATYDCTLDAPRTLREEAGKVLLTPIQFPGVAEGAWKFRATVTRDKKGLFIDIAWPDNPIQLAGKFAGLPTADGSFAFAPYSTGPCMFTESACLSLVNLVDAGDGTAKVIIQPSALASDKANNSREPFVAVIEGKCTRSGNSK